MRSRFFQLNGHQPTPGSQITSDRDAGSPTDRHGALREQSRQPVDWLRQQHLHGAPIDFPADRVRAAKMAQTADVNRTTGSTYASPIRPATVASSFTGTPERFCIPGGNVRTKSAIGPSFTMLVIQTKIQWKANIKVMHATSKPRHS